jgi:S-DNA-T family DNA segregation ATPase FtsK/SpoIIIE
MKMKRKKRKGGQLSFRMGWKDERIPKLVGVLLLFLSIYLFIAFTAYLFTWKEDFDVFHPFSWEHLFNSEIHVANWLGRLGAAVSNALFYWGFGLPSYIFVYLLMRMGVRLIQVQNLDGQRAYIRNMLFIMVMLSIFLETIAVGSAFPWGGSIGEGMMDWMYSFVGLAGLIAFFVAVSGAALIWHINPDFRTLTLSKALTDIRHWALGLFGKTMPISDASSEMADELPDPGPEFQISEGLENDDPDDEQSLPGIESDTPLRPAAAKEEPQAPMHGTQLEIEISDQDPGTPEHEKPTIAQENKEDGLEPYDPTLDLSMYQFPGLELLEIHGSPDFEVDRETLESNKDHIIATLLNYKIEITKIKATIGPTITLYEIVPSPGIRISTIKNLEDDIALSLSALGIRIIAPIPGKGTVGIEVPNRKKQTVSLREVLNSSRFQNAKMDLPIALGKTIANEVFVADLAKMPHLLIAGATGQGKSVGINTIVMSLLYKQHPSMVKIVMIDPKKVELFPYSKLENHFLACLPNADESIVTDTTQVVHTLNSLLIEMEQRYNLLKKAHARNIKEYNKKFVSRKLNPEKGHRFLPFIVLIIDEFADLIMTAGKEIELPIGRLAQLSRAVGIHLIIATQRPSVNIITGVIKANFPARIAFKVTAKVDSRTILDMAGADRLIGRGDMLLSFDSELIRLQCAFVDTPEVERVIDHISAQPAYPEPYFLPEFLGEDSEMQASGFDITDLDDQFQDAARLVVQNQHGSTSMIQRRLKLGYNRAGRIMDQLEALGIVGPSEGSKAREVMVVDEIELEKILADIMERKQELSRNNMFGDWNQ